MSRSGSLGAILAARISTKLHLGTLEPGRGAWWAAIDDVILIYVYAIPVFVFLGLSSIVVAHVAIDPGTGETCDTVGVIGPIVHVVAGIQAAEALKLLAGRHDGSSPDNHGS